MLRVVRATEPTVPRCVFLTNLEVWGAMFAFHKVTAVLCLVLLAGCANNSKVPARVTPDDAAKTAMKGAQLVPVVEPTPEITRRIDKRFISTGGAGGLIGLGVVLTSALVSAAVENASSDIDDVPVVEDDMAALVQAELIERIVEKTGAIHDPAVSISDPAREMNFLTSGKEKLMAAVKKGGHSGVIVDVRTKSSGVLSSGIRSAGDEQFRYITVMEAGLIDAKSGAVIGRSKCIYTSPTATLQRLKADRKKIADAYEAALKAREAQPLEGTEETASTDAGSKEAELPPKTFKEDIIRKTVGRCLRTFERELF